ncbi:helix-turn-helix domain-containing protein [uncultured Celeribacter sp.]|uniref:helix-turn-helix domain-containing protein n=1 Tax=uncultured Celeribacter sp. TaxID=1303376 RepID=UPI002AA93A75|nr:helix-turn-helix domain-containing protein [uncultured Celeribacter sp.]
MEKKTWSKAKIQFVLAERGMTLNGLAELKGINPSYMRHVWNRTVRPAEKALAEFIGVTPAELFPDRYPIRKSRLLSAENEALIARAKAQRAADNEVAA